MAKDKCPLYFCSSDNLFASLWQFYLHLWDPLGWINIDVDSKCPFIFLIMVWSNTQRNHLMKLGWMVRVFYKGSPRASLFAFFYLHRGSLLSFSLLTFSFVAKVIVFQTYYLFFMPVTRGIQYMLYGKNQNVYLDITGS